MITETGRVVAVESDCVWVETIRKSTCNSCSAKKGCGYGLLNETAHARRHHVRALVGRGSPSAFTINDVVRISIPEGVIVKGALLVYILPLLFMLFAASAVTWLGAGDGPAMLAAIIGLLLGFVWVRWRSMLYKDDEDQQPLVLPVKAPINQCVQVRQL